MALVASATAACGADPAPSPRAHGLVHAESGGGPIASGGASGSGGRALVMAGAATVTASSGGMPSSRPAAGGGTAHSGESSAPHPSGGHVAGSTLDFEQRCHESATDECAHCVCSECATEAEACERQEGCAEIAACVLQSACEGAACFCGTTDAVRCLSGAGNGPCKDVILSAPGGHSPTLADQSAGPAADAAAALGACIQPPSGVCAAECP